METKTNRILINEAAIAACCFPELYTGNHFYPFSGIIAAFETSINCIPNGAVIAAALMLDIPIRKLPIDSSVKIGVRYKLLGGTLTDPVRRYEFF